MHLHIGGLRVPGIAVWPNVIKPGSSSEELVSTLDVFATILDVADVPLPSDRVMDSHTLTPLFDGSVAEGATNWTRDSAFFYRGCYLFAVRHKEWKVHLNITPPETQPPAWNYTSAHTPLLFQIEADPSERFPLVDAGTVQPVMAEINAVIAKHRAQLGTPPAGILAVPNGTQFCCDEKTNCSCTPKPPPSV